MRVLITGGSGVFGKNMIQYLAAKGGHEIISFDHADPDMAFGSTFTFIKGDIRNTEEVSNAMKGVDVVIHAAAAMPSYSRKDIRSTDVGGTYVLLNSAWKHNVQRFIHISSTAVYGLTDDLPSRESDDCKAYDPYNVAKIEAEQRCEQYRGRGMCIPILRPKSFLGKERLGLFGILFEWAFEGRNFPIIGTGNVPYQFLDVRDLCEAAHLCMIEDRQAVNSTLNIAATEFSTLRDDFQSVLDEAGHGKQIVSLPATPMVQILQLLAWCRLSPLYRRLFLKLVQGSWVDTSKAQSVLGFVPQYSNKHALADNYRWYVANRQKIGSRTGKSHNIPWKQGVLGWSKALF